MQFSMVYQKHTTQIVAPIVVFSESKYCMNIEITVHTCHHIMASSISFFDQLNIH